MRSHTDIYNVVYTIYHSITYEVPQVQYTIRTRFTPIPTPLTLRQLFELLYTSGQFLGTVGFAVRFSTFAWAFAQNESELSPKSIQSCFQLLQGPSCSKQPSAVSPFSIQPGQNTITVVRRIEQVLTVIYCNWAPAEAGNSSDYILEKPPTHFEARKTNFQHFRGNSSFMRTNVLKGTSSTDCKSNCLRIGLKNVKKKRRAMRFKVYGKSRQDQILPKAVILVRLRAPCFY